ncbi:DUF302 domain-containing protein [Actinoplanes sp. M2I2]|uniref:DUF302 domain-containing protein n=1 Tax=Actinoplanes sp. M2I2 TaxID=1734444 RepID=UPI00202010A3|nr:DUF302 domain-containing protein [Actinoplanes sp. M2I2]
MTVRLERVTLQSSRPFDEVLDRIYDGISRPDLAAAQTWAAASTYEEFERLVALAAGPAGLMQFLRLDLDTALQKIPDITPHRIVRIIAGNPVTMSRMTRSLPHAGSYAPVTLLIWQDGDVVRLAYDTMQSLLSSYGDQEALAVARELDDEVLGLLRAAA